MKKEFEEAVGGGSGGGQALQGGMATNIKGGSLTTAIVAAAGPAVEVAKMLDTSGGVHAGGSVSGGDDVLPPVNENDHLKMNEISGNATDVTMRKISAQMASTMGLGSHAAACIDGGEGVVDADRDMEDYTPHFQRVSVSGDDNTGVS